MSVNIFGSSGRQPSKSDNKYVDRKFITLTTNLDSIMDKSGGSFSGAVSSSHVPTDNFHLINKSFLDAALANRLNDDDMKIIENRLSLKVNLTGDQMNGPILMGDHKITSSRVPEADDELVPKSFLNTRFLKNNVGYIPNMAKSNAQSGFVSSASSEYVANTSFFPFCSWNGSWRTNSKEGMWIQIKCPENVRVYKFALRGVPDRTARIYNWQLEASSDGSHWVILYSVVNKYIGDATEFINVNTTNPPWAKYYKLVVNEAEGVNPGISYMQLFTLDQVVNTHP